MYKEIENILVRTLSPYEYEKLEELKKSYTEQQIIDTYKSSNVKNINYIVKVLQNKKTIPEWLNREIVNEPLDEETIKEGIEFKKFIEEFRNGK
jgi:hypothetical protein